MGGRRRSHHDRDPARDPSPRDPQSGLPTGQRMHKPFVFTDDWESPVAAKPKAKPKAAG
jgi:hypothetical protein